MFNLMFQMLHLLHLFCIIFCFQFNHLFLPRSSRQKLRVSDKRKLIQGSFWPLSHSQCMGYFLIFSLVSSVVVIPCLLIVYPRYCTVLLHKNV